MILIDYKDKRPLFEQITERFKKLICSGGLSPDSRLPSVRSLAVELAINPNTISRAYHELESEGYIYTVKGKGCFTACEEDIKRLKYTRYKADLKEIIMKGREQGFDPSEVKALGEEALKEVYDD